MATLGLCHCTQAFSSCSEQGPLSGCSVQAFHCRGLSGCGAEALGARDSVAEAHGLSCPLARGLFPGQGLNSCPLHQQADS